MHAYLPHTLKIGRKSIAVRDLADASCAYQDEFWSAYRRDVNAKLPTGSVPIGGTESQIDRNARVFADGVLVMEAQ